MTSTELVPFNGADIRTVDHEGVRVAYMPDVAQSFGLRPDNIIRGLDPWDYVSAGQGNPSNLRGCIDAPNPSPHWLTESGIWHLAYKLSAELRRKVNEEVLPALRKTGSYGPAKQPRAPRVGSAAYYAHWIQQGCVEFHDNGRPKAFNPDAPLFAASLIRGIVDQQLATKEHYMQQAVEEVRILAASTAQSAQVRLGIAPSPAPAASNFRDTPAQNASWTYDR